MKRKLTIVVMVIFALALFTGTVAYADNGDKLQKAQDKLEFLNDVQPLLQEIKDNREQIHTKFDQLKSAHKQAKEHIKALKANSGALTDEQIQLIQNLTQQISDTRIALKNTSIEMIQQKQHLREMRRSKNYDEILATYGNIISIQEKRITQLDKLISINGQIAAI